MKRIIKYLTIVCSLMLIIVVTVLVNSKGPNIEQEDTIVLVTSYDVEIQQDIKDFIDESSLIVEGTVTQKNDSIMVPVISKEDFDLLEEEQKIYYQDIITQYSFQVKNVLKGECNDETIIYNVKGGKYDNYEQVFSDKEIYGLPEIGNEYILFLKEDSYGGYSTYSVVQGRIDIVDSILNKDDDIDKIATNDPLFSDCEYVGELESFVSSTVLK